jgi:hypothetical protein
LQEKAVSLQSFYAIILFEGKFTKGKELKVKAVNIYILGSIQYSDQLQAGWLGFNHQQA